MRRFDALMDRLVNGGKWLVIPIVALLFLQWPLRDGVQAFSREANDLGQILFAFYVASAVTAATRARSHIAVETFAQRYSARTRRVLHRVSGGLLLVPWATFVLIAGRPMVLNSLSQLERFQDTGNPGYFLIKLAVWVLAVFVVMAGLSDLCSRGETEAGS